jgi:DNA polymerase III alpha subunit
LRLITTSKQKPNCEYGEYPDIDVDYLGIVRDYLKTEWAPKEFGEQLVCNISNYTTFGLKSALIDMARVHSESREEVQGITKNLESQRRRRQSFDLGRSHEAVPRFEKILRGSPASRRRRPADC